MSGFLFFFFFWTCSFYFLLLLFFKKTVLGEKTKSIICLLIFWCDASQYEVYIMQIFVVYFNLRNPGGKWERQKTPQLKELLNFQSKIGFFYFFSLEVIDKEFELSFLEIV